MRAGFTDNKDNIQELVEQLKTAELPRDEVQTVSTKTPYVSTGSDLSVVLLDFGKKQNIVRELNLRGCNVTVVPYDTSAEEILSMSPDGVMLSNGPGDPDEVDVALDTIRGILGKIPFLVSALVINFCIIARRNFIQNEIWTSWCEPSR